MEFPLKYKCSMGREFSVEITAGAPELAAYHAAPQHVDRFVEIAGSRRGSRMFLNVLDLFRGHIEPRACARMVRTLIS